MTIEEFRDALAADFQYTADRINEAIKADMAPQQMVREANVWLGAAAIVRSHPVASPWILVGERLPEDGATVLVASRYNVRVMYVAQCNYNLDPEDGTTDVRWYVDGEGETFPEFWMHLPKPPSEPTP